MMVLLALLAATVPFEQMAREASAEREANHLERAVALYSEGVARKKDWAEGWWYLGTIAYDRDRYGEAAGHFRQFLKLKPDIAAGWDFLGLCEFGTRDDAAALGDLIRAEQFGAPEEHVAQVAEFHRVILLTRAGRFDEAMGRVTRAATRLAASDDWYVAAGLAGLRRPLLPTELRVGERPLVRGTGEAIWLQANRRTDDALRTYEALAARYPDASGLHFLFGSCLLGKNVERGLAELEKELAIKPDHVPALVVLSQQALTRGNLQEAATWGRRAVEVAPSDFAAHLAYGRVLAQQELYGESVREFEGAKALAPGSPEIRFALASAYAKSGKPAEAAAERAEFLKLRKLREAQSPGRP